MGWRHTWAVVRGLLRVRLLVSHWAHTRPAMARYTARLAAPTGTELKDK